MIRTALLITIAFSAIISCQTKKTAKNLPEKITEIDSVNSNRISQNQTIESDFSGNDSTLFPAGNELPELFVNLDKFRISNIADSMEIQNISHKVVVSVGISDKQIDAQKKLYGEDDFYTVADDHMYYGYMFEKLLDSAGIKIVNSESRFIKFSSPDRSYVIDLEKKETDGLFWTYIVFNEVNPPQIINDIIIEDVVEIAEFMGVEELGAPSINKSVSCYFSNKPISLGIGLVVQNTSEIEIFNDKGLNELYWKISMENIDRENQKCCPMYHKPDYGIMNFVCLEELENSFKILVNDSIVKYTPKDPARGFVSWEKYIKNAIGIKRSTHNVSIQPKQNPFRKEPNYNAELIDNPKEYNSICPIEFRGEWLKVEINCKELCVEPRRENCNSRTTAWIRWRMEDEILIDIALLS